MPYTMSWLIPSKLLYVKITGKFPYDEIIHMLDEVNEELELKYNQEPADQVRSLTHLLMDNRQQVGMINVSELNRTARYMQDTSGVGNVHERIGWTIVITNNILLRFGTSLFAQFGGFRLRMVETPESAITFLSEQDGRIGDTEITFPS